MNIKGYIIIILIISIIIITGCSKNIMIDPEDEKLLNYDFKIRNINNVDETLKNQSYAYTTDIDKKFIDIITYKDNKAEIKQYKVSNSDKLNLDIPLDSNFIISLPANRTINYTWNIKNNINKETINFKSRSWIEIPVPKSDRDKDGTNYDRQNFYFKSLKAENQKIIMIYEDKSEQNKDFFEVELNINIQ